MSKSNRQRKVIAQRARVQARAAVEAQGDKFLRGLGYAERKADCIATWEAHKAAQVLVEGGIIATHW